MHSFSIEAPGETNPLTETNLLQTLRAASSNNPQSIQSGTKQLQQWETSSGFYKNLQTVFIAQECPVEIRHLAVIQLKNGIDKYWRKTANNAVNKEDKNFIRSRLLSSGLDEPDQRLALQNALVIAKIVRFEYPNDWPEAISNVLNAIRNAIQDPTGHRLQRSLLILLHIIKELSTARLHRSRTNLQAATPEMLGVLGPLYVEKVARWRNSLASGGGTDQVQIDMMHSLLILKTLRRLVISGYDFPNREDDVRGFWEITLDHLQTIKGLVDRQHHSPADASISLAHKHIVQLSKFHLDMSGKHPAAFVLLPNSLDLVRAYWNIAKQFSESYSAKTTSASAVSSDGEAEDTAKATERLTLNGLLLIRACLKMAFKPTQTFRYKHESDKQERKQAEASIKTELFTVQLVQDIMDIVVTRFLVLRQADLVEWTEDSEDWVNKQENESEDMNLSVRACSERLVLDLSIYYKSELVAAVTGLLHSVANLQNEQVLFKDAVYAAIGMAAAMYKEDIDFDALLTSVLVPEVQKQIEGANILRRRIAIFIAQWVVVKVAKESRPVIYQVFDHILSPGDGSNDLVVRITAGQQFKNVVDDFDFDAKQFAPYAESIITKLMELIQEVEQTATKILLLETISALIERFEYHIEPFADRIVNMLPPLWEQSGDEHLMKQSILTILSRLVLALKEASARFHAMLIPIVQNAVQSDSEMQVYLLEEALNLWHSILVQSNAPASPEILSLVQHLLPFFDLASEALREALEIAQSYILLAPEAMLSPDARTLLVTKYTALIGGKARAESSGMVCASVELLLRQAETLGGEPAVRALAADLVATGFLAKQLRGLRGAWVAHCTTGPLAKTPAVDGVVETDYLSVLARILLCSPGVFVDALAAAADADDGATPEEVLKWLLEEWFSHLENIGDPGRRKLMCLALTRLLGAAHPAALGALQLMMGMWTSVVAELCEGDAPALDGDCLVYADPGALRGGGDGEPEEPEEGRRRALAWGDAVHRVGVPAAVRAALGAVVAAVGGEARFRDEWLVNVDGDVVAAFGALGIM